MKIPKHFKLVKEHPDSYEIYDERDNKRFHVAKKDLDLGMHANLSKIQKFAEGGEAESTQESPTTQAPVVVNVGQPAPTQPLMSVEPPAPVANATSAATGLPINANAPQAAAQIPAIPQIPQIPAPPPLVAPPKVKAAPSFAAQGIANEALSEKGITALNNAEALQHERDADTIQTANIDRENRMQAFQKSRDDLDSQNRQLSEEVMKEKIDPDRWWHNRSLPGKVSTAFGVILGGIGAGLQHSNTNQALQVMQDAIKEDIEAQKTDLGKKQTLLSRNLQRYRDLPAAMAATEQQMTAMLAGQLQLSAARSGSAKAKANSDYAVGLLRNKYLLEAPNLSMQDYKINELHQLNGSAPPPNAAQHILGTPPAGAKAAGAPEGSAPWAAGPGAGDQLREQNVLQGKPMPMDPARYGTGINLNKLTALKVAGLIDKETGNKATEEYGKYTKLQHELQEADSVFNIASQNATIRGRIARHLQPHEIEGGGSSIVGDLIKPIAYGLKNLTALGDEKTKQYSAVVEPFVDKLAKDVTGRSTPISIEKLGTLMPEQGDDLKTLAIKRAKLHDTLKSSYTFPTLMERRLVDPNDPLLNLDSERK